MRTHLGEYQYQFARLLSDVIASVMAALEQRGPRLAKEDVDSAIGVLREVAVTPRRVLPNLSNGARSPREPTEIACGRWSWRIAAGERP